MLNFVKKCILSILYVFLPKILIFYSFLNHLIVLSFLPQIKKIESDSKLLNLWLLFSQIQEPFLF